MWAWPRVPDSHAVSGEAPACTDKQPAKQNSSVTDSILHLGSEALFFRKAFSILVVGATVSVMAGIGRAGVGWDTRERLVSSTLAGLSVPPPLPSKLCPPDQQVVEMPLCSNSVLCSFLHWHLVESRHVFQRQQPDAM